MLISLALSSLKKCHQFKEKRKQLPKQVRKRRLLNKKLLPRNVLQERLEMHLLLKAVRKLRNNKPLRVHVKMKKPKS